MNKERNIELLGQAKKEKRIDEESYKILVGIAAHIEPSAQMVRAQTVILIPVMVDDSPSVWEYKNDKAVREGHNSVIEALKGSQEHASILFRTQYLHGYTHNNWVKLRDAKSIEEDDYKPVDDTPLYDSTIELIGSTIIKMQEARDENRTVRFSGLIISDGEHYIKAEDDRPSVKARKAERVNKVIRDLFDRSNADFQNTLAFMGIRNKRLESSGLSFRSVANSMGIDDERVNKKGQPVMQIIETYADATSIRRAFEMFSEFSQTGEITIYGRSR
ncbi:MAG: hypothetical protein ACREUI_00350 [Burkholderiales bacterium]